MVGCGLHMDFQKGQFPFGPVPIVGTIVCFGSNLCSFSSYKFELIHNIEIFEPVEVLSSRAGYGTVYSELYIKLVKDVSFSSSHQFCLMPYLDPLD